MLTIKLLVNGKEIDTINIINQNIKKKGKTLYLVNKKYRVWHNSKYGARMLALKVLKKLMAEGDEE